MWEYSDKVKDAFTNPKNIGSLPDANAIGEVGSLSCGDALKLYLKVNPETEIIEKATFETFGCASAIASSSMLTEMIIGKTITEAESITNKQIAKELDGLPKEKMHCSVMGEEALIAAIRNYRGLPPEEHEEEHKIICYCFNVSEETVLRAIEQNNLTTREEVAEYTKAGASCGGCWDAIDNILFEANSGQGVAAKHNPMKVVQSIMTAIYTKIVPQLPSMTDLEIVELDESVLRVKLSGESAKTKEKRSESLALITSAVHEVEPTLKIYEVL